MKPYTSSLAISVLVSVLALSIVGEGRVHVRTRSTIHVPTHATNQQAGQRARDYVYKQAPLTLRVREDMERNGEVKKIVYTRRVHDKTTAPGVPSPPGVLQYTDPFIGTSGFGYGAGSQFPGAQVPFGVMRVSPDTSLGLADLPFQHCGGYAYEDTDIRAFSHIHLVGAGVTDLGMLGILPRTESFDVKCTDHFSCMAKFSHNEEVASPGYYKVVLGSGIQVELTATQTGAIHRYTFPANNPGHFFVDLGHSLAPNAASNISINYDSSTQQLTGYVLDNGGYARRVGGINVWFVLECDHNITDFGVWDRQDVMTGKTSVGPNSTNAGFFGSFVNPNPSQPLTVELRLSISTVSAQNAALNFAHDSLSPRTGSATFESVVAQAQTHWLSILNRVQVNTTGGVSSPSDLIKVYSGLYHAHMAPTNYSEPTGQYIGYDNKVHTIAPGSTGFFSDMSIWDTHRSQSPLMSLTVPEVQTDLINSLLLMSEQGGSLPRWPLYRGYTGGMLGCHSNPIIADAYLKGIPGNYSALLEAMVKQATGIVTKPIGYNDIAFYMKNGYVSHEASTRSVCDTLAYAFDDFAISQVACGLNATSSDCTLFKSRGQNYKNVYESKRVLMCPRNADGSWKCPSVIEEINVFSNNYAEGDALQYRWFVPHDPDGLIALMGNATYLQKLTEFFDLYPIDKSRVLPNPYYWAGNEPDLFSPWMFNFVGKPSLTQKWSRYSLANDYSDQPDGIPGNDDYGTMSAWQFFAALGFYPQTGTGHYVVGSPLFPSVTITHPNGYKLTITASNPSPQNIYVKSISINGTPLQTPTFAHSLISKGGTIVFDMTSEPTDYFTY